MKGLAHLGLSPAWWHVDASWAGPLAFSSRYRGLLKGIDDADSVTVSTHKLMFQPTESALVLFRNAVRSDAVLEFAGPDNTTQIGCWDRGLTDRWRLRCCCLPTAKTDLRAG